MNERGKSKRDVPTDPVDRGDRVPGTATRRTFLSNVGRKAIYITPVLWTLTAQQALAVGSNPSANPSCIPNGELCDDDADCCSNNCVVGTCEE